MHSAFAESTVYLAQSEAMAGGDEPANDCSRACHSSSRVDAKPVVAVHKKTTADAAARVRWQIFIRSSRKTWFGPWSSTRIFYSLVLHPVKEYWTLTPRAMCRSTTLFQSPLDQFRRVLLLPS